MKIRIQTHDFKVRDEVTDFVKQNIAAKLERYGDRIIECDVMLKLDRSDAVKNKVCELRLVIPGNDLFASKKGDSFEDAVLKSVDALRHQIARWKDSINDGQLRGAAGMPEP